jgi:hypothetical protein
MTMVSEKPRGPLTWIEHFSSIKQSGFINIIISLRDSQAGTLRKGET